MMMYADIPFLRFDLHAGIIVTYTSETETCLKAIYVLNGTNNGWMKAFGTFLSNFTVILGSIFCQEFPINTLKKNRVQDLNTFLNTFWTMFLSMFKSYKTCMCWISKQPFHC